MDQERQAEVSEEREGVTGETGADPESSGGSKAEEEAEGLFSGMVNEEETEESSEEEAPASEGEKESQEAVPPEFEFTPGPAPVPPSPPAEAPGEAAKPLDVKDVADFITKMTGERVPHLSPELTEEQREEMGESEILAYETQRKIEILEAKDFLRTKVQQATMGMRELEGYARKYSHPNSPPITSQELFNHMKARRIFHPEDAARSLSFERAMKAAENRGAMDAMQKVAKPSNPARPLKGGGKPVKSVQFYKNDAEAHAGAMAILKRMEDEREGRQSR